MCEICNGVATLLYSHSQQKKMTCSHLLDTKTGSMHWQNLGRIKTQFHRGAVLKLSHVTRRTNVVDMLSTAHQQERHLAKIALYATVTSLHYLCKQGLAIMGLKRAESKSSP